MSRTLRTLKIDGRKYRVSRYDWQPGVLYLNGPGIVGGSGRETTLTLDSAELRPFVVAWLAEYRANRKRAGEEFQKQLRAGIASPTA